MATYRVVPLPDGVSQRYGWQVMKNGRRISRHTKKSAAKRKARQQAGRGDSVRIHDKQGRIIR